MRKSQLFRLISPTPSWALVINTIPQAIASTTTVRMAVAKLELTSSMPTLAKMDVSAANTAEPSAKTNHIYFTSVCECFPAPDMRQKCQ